jgi:hypothetical protein
MPHDPTRERSGRLGTILSGRSFFGGVLSKNPPSARDQKSGDLGPHTENDHTVVRVLRAPPQPDPLR